MKKIVIEEKEEEEEEELEEEVEHHTPVCPLLKRISFSGGVS